MSWEEIKTAVELATGLSRDALHIYAAVLIQLTAAAISRRGLANPLPWLCVFAFALINEWTDVNSDRLFEEWEIWAAIHDLWNTMLLPTILCFVTRFAPELLESQASTHDAS